MIGLDALLWWTLKGTAVIAAAGLALTLLRRQPAAMRHAVWTIALVAQLLIPAAELLVPAKTLEVPVRMPAMQAATVAPATPSGAAGDSPADRRRVGGGSTGIREILPYAWLLGAAVILLRLLYGTLRIFVIARRSRRVVDGHWLALLQTTCREMNIVRPVTLISSVSLQLPVTWGFVYPTVLLPESAKTWPDAVRRHVLLHELAHVRRLDALGQLATQLVLAVFWFNPLVWLAARQARAEAENACDDYVLRGGERPSVYATTLLELVRSHVGATAPAFASLGVGRKSDLEERVSAITHPRRNCAPPTRPSVAAIALFALLLVGPMAIIRSSQADERPAKRESVARGDCRAFLIDSDEVSGMHGTLRAGKGKPEVHYFFFNDAERCVEASFSTATRFTEDDRDIVPDPGVEALVREKRGSNDRALWLAFGANGAVSRRFLVNGKERPFDGDAQRWYAAIMPEFIRTTSAGIANRAQRIVERDGVDGLFAEISRNVQQIDVRADYLRALLRLRGPDALSRERVIGKARELITGESPFAAFLRTVAEREGHISEVRDAILAATEDLEQEVEKAQVLRAFARNGDPLARAIAIDRIDMLDSAVERRAHLEELAPAFLGADQASNDLFSDAVELIDDDIETRLLIETLSRQMGLPASVRERLVDAAEAIGDEGERGVALRALGVARED